MSTLFIDKLMYARDSRKKISTISDKGKEIGCKISDVMGKGVTVVNAIGAHEDSKKELVIYICPSKDVSRVKELAFSVDENALCYVSTSDEVAGRAFS